MKTSSKILLLIGLGFALSVSIYLGFDSEIKWIQSLTAAIFGVVFATIAAPHNQRWLWRMSRWFMQKFGKHDREREGTTYIPEKYEVTKEVQSSVSSLSELRNIRSPELWVVSSGKGGVGKSLLSLGLAEYLSKREPVLLVDFDLHNRGLTSLLKVESANVSTTFDLLGEFQNMLRQSPDDSPYKAVLEAPTALPSTFTEENFSTMCLKFAREIRLEKKIWDNVGKYRRIEPKFPDVAALAESVKRNDKRGLYAANLRFLPSRMHGHNFLLSDQSTASYLVVSLFLEAFCEWIKETVTVTTIILDCHGAHDHLTAGAIVAADKLLVVTTTDPGSHDGTAELLNFVSGLRGREVPTVIALNHCQSWDNRFAVADSGFREYENELQIRGVLHLEHNAAIRQITNDYHFGQIAMNDMVWQHVCSIADLLKKKSDGDGQVPEELEVTKGTPIPDDVDSLTEEDNGKGNVAAEQEDAPSEV